MHIYFIGIGGSGLSPLAQLALDCGFDVSGSDIQESFGTSEVEKRGVTLTYDQTGKGFENIHKNTPIDWVIYSAACKTDHPELILTDKLGIKKGKRDTFINYILKEKSLKMLAVAGTHGKTTTTAMVVWLFKQLNIPVSYLIGSNISFGPAAHYQQGSEYFVYEADEFDNNFLQYNPFASIITNIDYDHPDTYPTKSAYYSSFNQFLQQVSEAVFLWSDSYSMLPKVHRNIDSNLIISTNKSDISNQINLQFIKLTGEHNRQNALLALQLVGWIVGRDNHELYSKINTFPGTQRRFEKIGENIYSDYAHHPTEIAATLQLARELSDNIIVVYQPHQNIRQHEIKELYVNCFDQAKKVYWLPTYLSRENDALEILSPQTLISYVNNNKKVLINELDTVLKDNLTYDLSRGSIIVGMGAGSIDAWMRKNLTNIEK